MTSRGWKLGSQPTLEPTGADAVNSDRGSYMPCAQNKTVEFYNQKTGAYESSAAGASGVGSSQGLQSLVDEAKDLKEEYRYDAQTGQVTSIAAAGNIDGSGLKETMACAPIQAISVHYELHRPLNPKESTVELAMNESQVRQHFGGRFRQTTGCREQLVQRAAIGHFRNDNDFAVVVEPLMKRSNGTDAGDMFAEQEKVILASGETARMVVPAHASLNMIDEFDQKVLHEVPIEEFEKIIKKPEMNRAWNPEDWSPSRLQEMALKNNAADDQRQGAKAFVPFNNSLHNLLAIGLRHQTDEMRKTNDAAQIAQADALLADSRTEHQTGHIKVPYKLMEEAAECAQLMYNARAAAFVDIPTFRLKIRALPSDNDGGKAPSLYANTIAAGPRGLPKQSAIPLSLGATVVFNFVSGDDLGVRKEDVPAGIVTQTFLRNANVGQIMHAKIKQLHQATLAEMRNDANIIPPGGVRHA